MAAQRARPQLSPLPARLSVWNAERIAAVLGPQRDALVDRLPRELAAARGLTRDQHELVIDEALDYMVTEYAKPIEDEHALWRAFWATAAFRVKRVHEGRGATVRAGWQRVDVADVEVATSDADPFAHAVNQVEQAALLEFAATLTEPERGILACKFVDGPKERGRVVVARQLGLPVVEVRRAERSIARKLDRFVAIMAAGSLCTHRRPAIEAVAQQIASDEQTLAARVHLTHCAACRVAYSEYVRALRLGDIQHRLAQLLPFPAAAAEQRRRGGAWEAVVDCASRPFASEAASAGAHVAAGARGLGTAVSVKFAALCLGGVTAVGGTYCVTSVLQPDLPAKTRTAPADVRQGSTVSTPREPPLPSAGTALTAIAEARAQEREQKRRARAAHERAAVRSAAAAGGRPETRHEREVPISPPVSVAGTSAPEFGPGPSAPVDPAPAPAPSSGAPEFP